MAGEKAVPPNQALSAVSAIGQLAPLVLGSGKQTTTSRTTSSPVATDALTRIINDSMYDANNPAVVDAMVQEILRKSALEFSPNQALEKQSGMYNTSTLQLMRDRAKADATGAAAKAALDFQTNQRGIAANAAGSLAQATRETTQTSKAAPAIPTWASLGIGGAMAAKSLFSNAKDITKFLEDPFTNTKKMLLEDEVGGDIGEGTSNFVDGIAAAGGFSLGGGTSDFTEGGSFGSFSDGGGVDSFGSDFTDSAEGLAIGDDPFLVSSAFSMTSSDDPEGVGVDINEDESFNASVNNDPAVDVASQADIDNPAPSYESMDFNFADAAKTTGRISSAISIGSYAGIEQAQQLSKVAGPALGIAGLGFNVANNFTNPNYSLEQAIGRTAVQVGSKLAPFPVNIAVNWLGLKAVDWVFGKEPSELVSEFMSNPLAEASWSIGNMQQTAQQVETSPQLGLGTYASALDNIDTDFGLGPNYNPAFDAWGDPVNEAADIDWNTSFGSVNDYDGAGAAESDDLGAAADYGGETSDFDDFGGFGGGSGADDSSDDGGSIICTELMKQGRLSKKLWIIGSKEFAGYWEHGKVGYYLWSIPAVAHLKQSPDSYLSHALEVIFNKRAEYVAARTGYKKYKKTLLGAVITKGMYAACWTLAVLATPFVSKKIIATAKAGA